MAIVADDFPPEAARTGCTVISPLFFQQNNR